MQNIDIDDTFLLNFFKLWLFWVNIEKSVFKVAKFVKDDVSHSENLLGCIENHLENWSIWVGPEGLNSENLT